MGPYAHLLLVGVPSQGSFPEGALHIALADEAPFCIQPQHGIVPQEVLPAPAIAAAAERGLMVRIPCSLLMGLAPALPPPCFRLSLDAKLAQGMQQVILDVPSRHIRNTRV